MARTLAAASGLAELGRKENNLNRPAVSRRDWLLGTLSAAAVAPALARASTQAVSTPRVTSVDERSVQEALKVQRSTLRF